MEKYFASFGFTEKEWENCIKVLTVLKDKPFDNPDNNAFGALVAKIYKNAKKSNRDERYAAMREQDIATHLNATLTKNATDGKTIFWDDNFIQNHEYTKLNLLKNCYGCNESYALAHSFYTRLCPVCAEENYNKRFQKTNLKGRIAILTGGRVKVGYATALHLLRNEATVVLTTRFPALALSQFQQENDYDYWKDRLTIYGLDLRNLNAIQEFVAFYKSKFNSLDILINNAAQTIKYPAEYYVPLLKKEESLLASAVSDKRITANTTPLYHELKALEYDYNESTKVELNRFGQPVDHRDKTSWNSTLEEISLHELIEVNLINHIAPYFLVKELKSLFMESSFAEKFIVNVTSSEGIFSYANKTIFHPHTNMTKAALNMMTLTSAREFVEDNIYMTSVDVGWISTGAKESLRKKQFEEGYIPPLDSMDGTARIMDPIIQGIHGNYLYGVLLKNYKVSPW